MVRRLLPLMLLMICFVAAGCMRRTITISSEPTGALVWLNGREIGRTPVTVDFLFYGNYDVQLQAEGFEPLITTGQAKAPLWDTVPLDLVAEITPGEKHSRIAWHYELAPRNDDPQLLLERARQLRGRVVNAASSPPESAPPAESTAEKQP